MQVMRAGPISFVAAENGIPFSVHSFKFHVPVIILQHLQA
jgi:hypothetical protein